MLLKSSHVKHVYVAVPGSINIFQLDNYKPTILDNYVYVIIGIYAKSCTGLSIRYLRNLRASTNKAPDLYFIKSCVWAEMKNSTSYDVDISLDKDGVVQEAQCECGAGMAPTAHCKHIAATLWGFVKFCENGMILTELTCTQVNVNIICHCHEL